MARVREQIKVRLIVRLSKLNPTIFMLLVEHTGSVKMNKPF
jgi:hypothetical protein